MDHCGFLGGDSNLSEVLCGGGAGGKEIWGGARQKPCAMFRLCLGLEDCTVKISAGGCFQAVSGKVEGLLFSLIMWRNAELKPGN